MARIWRDAYGVPHVRAGTVSDLAEGQGRVTARDRSWQLEYLRRRATGTTAELIGVAALPWDRLARRTEIAASARRAFVRLRPETAAFVASYVAGVNAGLHADSPEFRAARRPSRSSGSRGRRSRCSSPSTCSSPACPASSGWAGPVEVLGDDARLLSHEGPEPSGSNAWAVGGDRTASGFPLIGGDPHRVIESPGVYQQVRLSCDEFDVVGFAFPGVPGIQHFGHAGDVAWAITNAMADYQDVYDERLRRTDGGVEALGPDGWQPADARVETIAVAGRPAEQVEVVVTARGPVFDGSVEAGRGLSLRAASVVLEDHGFDAILPLLHARTADDVMRALDDWVEPVNNVVAADRDGAVRYRVAGRVPVRADANRRGVVDAADPAAAWTGWLDPLPRHDVAPDGQVVTANERRGQESDAIGTSFAPPHRAARINALLDGRDDLTTADFRDVHDDALLLPAPLFQDLVRDLDPGPAGAAVRAAILAWDGRMEATSQGAAAFAAWRSAFTIRLAAEPVFAPLAEPLTDDPVLAPWLDVAGRVGGALESLVAAGTPFGTRRPSPGPRRARRRGRAPGDLGRDPRAHAGARVRRTRERARAAAGAGAPRLRRHRLRALHVVGARPDRRLLARLGRALRLGPRRPRRRRLGGAARRDRRRPRPAPPRPAAAVGGGRAGADRHRLGPAHGGAMGLSLDPLVPARDAALIHSWVVEDRARFWMMGDHTVDEVREIYTWIDEQPTHHAWLVRQDGEPVALFQDYLPTAEEVGEHYDVQPGDLGVHFMLAPATVASPGFTGQVVQFLMAAVFEDAGVARIVVEPDARNAKAVSLVERLGFRLGPVVELSTKPAQLAFLGRDQGVALDSRP